ncbi:HD domain-containing protein [Rubinisphaera sp. JC750]|uniref:HD domain-containing protein n=1 Tax=Rubinisphaera sp. JC750 TaxID=2898658 RepID=UPI001F37460E|nr:HD domain-containing protein [Rubinisphaera sp. JC750]
MIDRAWDLPELTPDRRDAGLIRVPVEQDVPFTRRVRALVDTVEFQRLQYISQLGLVQRVYPGASHSRFEHALGVYHNAARYLSHLRLDERFVSICTPKDAELLLVAALLHDLGHWPFCHPIEDMALANIPDHEEFAREYLLGDGELNKVLRTVWDIDPLDVLDLLVAHSDNPSRQLLRSILSGPIDIDKMDYLNRDSLHCGVPYGRNFDRNRLISSLIINEAGDGVAITSKGKTAAEMMVFARYVMFSEVYWHHAVRSATTMFARAFFELRERIDLDGFFRDRESTSIEKLRDTGRDTVTEPLLEGIFGPRRMLFKRVAEFAAVQDGELFDALAHRPYRELRELTNQLQQELLGSTSDESIQLLIDAPPPRREVEFRVDLYFAKENRYRPLSTVSPVIEALATRQFDDYVKKVRLFAHPDVADSISQPRLEQAIRNLSSR